MLRGILVLCPVDRVEFGTMLRSNEICRFLVRCLITKNFENLKFQTTPSGCVCHPSVEGNFSAARGPSVVPCRYDWGRGDVAEQRDLSILSSLFNY